MDNEESYTVTEYAEMKDVNRATVYRWIEKGELRAEKVSDVLRVFPEITNADAFKAAIEVLREQLRVKDAQIEALLQQVESLGRIILGGGTEDPASEAAEAGSERADIPRGP